MVSVQSSCLSVKRPAKRGDQTKVWTLNIKPLKGVFVCERIAEKRGWDSFLIF